MLSTVFNWSTVLTKLGFTKKQQHARYRKYQGARRLRIERLEGRQMLAVVVDTLADERDFDITNDDVSLRDAILEANSGETITFNPTVSGMNGGTITLSAALGEIAFSKNLTIDASGLSLGITIKAHDPDANGNNDGDGSRALNITGSGSNNVTLKNLIFTNGDVNGAGGAIQSTTSLTLENCRITGNHSTGSGGGLSASVSSGSINIVDSTFHSNTTGSYSDGGGAYIYASNSSLTITNTTVTGNQALGMEANGGGMSLLAFTSTVTIDKLRVENNHADDDMGGLYLYNKGGNDVTLRNCTISGNTAAHNANYEASAGAWIRTHASSSTQGATTIIENSTISGNETQTVGVDNVPGGGLALFANTHAKTVLRNVTVFGNKANGGGGGIWVAQQFGGGQIDIQHSTITGNRSDGNNSGGETGGGIGIHPSSTTTVRLDNTIMAGNLRGTGAGTADDISGNVNSASSYNLIGNAGTAGGLSHGSNGNIVGNSGTGTINIATVLATNLANNGGPTQTHRLVANSPAIDAGNPSAVAGQNNVPLYDQRGSGFGRVKDVPGVNGSTPRIDIGAFEWMEGPRVDNVTISGSSSVDDPYSFDAVDGSGAQLISVPVGGADTISITFSEPVTILEDALTVVGMFTTQRPELADFSYDSPTQTASWWFFSLPADDMWLISLSDAVTNADGNRLDGEWVNPATTTTTNAAISEFPSGDGQAGVDFNFVVTLLGGDFSLDNVVDETDWAILETYYESYFGGFEYGDADGNGVVNYADMVAWAATEGFDFQVLVPLRADLDNDFDVDMDDYNILYDNWYNNLASPTMDDGDLNGDGVLNIQDFDLLLAQLGLRLTVAS
jgi:hypothetical protein